MASSAIHRHELELKYMMLAPESYVERLDLRNEFLTGGGTEKEWSKYSNVMKKSHEIRLQQMKEKQSVGSALTAVIITIPEKI